MYDRWDTHTVLSLDTVWKFKVMLYKTYYLSLTSEAKGWTWTKRDVSRLQAEGKKFLQTTKKQTRRDKI